MLCTDGRVFHNKVLLKAYPLKFANIEVEVKVDVAKGQMTVSGTTIEFGEGLPKVVYFVASVNQQTVDIMS
jgi:hypothetical protein